ncbi:MAG TPA: neuraminidase-like domain-containing protein [Nitrospira sp.]|jgi:ABC-type cobalt transport system substrate-binding protein|nr:neuraminidase-like domain-containing protein [Nitrospira sp.]
MNKQDFLQLAKLATSTPKEIEQSQPIVFNQLSEKASVGLKASIENKLTTVPKEIRESLFKIDFTPTKLGKQDVKSVLIANLPSEGLSPEKKKELVEVAGKLPNLGKLDDILLPEIPVFANPAFQPELMKAKVYRLSDIAGIAEAKIDQALAKDFNLHSISGEKLSELVRDNVLNETEATGLGLSSNLYQFFDSSFELAAHVKKTVNVTSMEDLVKLTRADWQKLVADSNVELPKDIHQQDYADLLSKKVEHLFPELSFTNRITNVVAEDVSKRLDTLRPLLALNEKPFGTVAFEDLKKEGLSEADLKVLRESHDSINKMSKVHPGLQLDAILNDKTLSPVNKAKAITDRIGLITTFVKNNADINWLSLEYKHDSEDIKLLNFEGFKQADKEMVLKSVKSYQRVYSFTDDIEHAEAIMAAGFHSSFHVTSVTLPEFIRATKLDSAIATKYFENAHMSIIKTTGMMGSVLDLLTGSFDWLRVGNVGPDIKDYLRKIPGYQDLFGELAFCDCEHCQSIYSPAAYFVDLMQFVERYVMAKHFTGAKAAHVLNLKVRRPDLWTLPLTCENTSTLIPYLDIINEILESYIASQKGFTGDVNNRTAVEEFVYKREIALEKPGDWKSNVHTFTQPYHHPLESVATYLGHFEKTREHIALLLKKPQEEVSITRLHVSDKEYQLITSPDSTSAFINRIYGMTFTEASGKIAPFNAQSLLKPMKVDRRELGRLFKTKFITNEGADAIEIKGEKLTADSIQNDIERVRNLTYAALDRAHRFVRVWRKTGWAIEELDLLISQLKVSGVATDIAAVTLTTIGHILRLQEQLKLSFKEVFSVIYGLPTISLEENEKSFLDSLFNHEDVVLAEGSYPKTSVKLIHPSLAIDQSSASAEFSSSRLIMALNRSDDEVLALIKHLARPLGIVALDSATESERGFNITLVNLSLLYRHSKIAEILKLPVGDLFRIMKLIPSITNGYLENIGHVHGLLDFVGWWRGTKLSIDELNYIIESGNIEDTASFKTKEEITAAILDQAKTNRALLFADTIYTVVKGVNEEQSRAILRANSTAIEPASEAGFLRLTKDYNPNSPLAIPAGVTVTEPDLRTVLNKHHPQYLLPHYLSPHTNFQEGTIGQMLSVLGLDLNADEYLLELHETTSPPVAIPALVAKLLPLSVLFKDKKFNADAVEYIIANLPRLGVASLDTLTVGDIRTLLQFSQFITVDEDGKNNISTLADVLGSFANATQFQGADQKKLATVLGVKPEVVATIHPVAVPSSNVIQALVHYRDVSQVCAYIGIGGDALPKIISSQYDDLNQAANALLAAFRGKYKSESERKDKLEKYQDKLRGTKRTSLITYLMHSGFPQFANTNDLFHYFLIDTELEGCARTSRLVAATMSLQLYIHRILLNLEQDDQEPGAAGRLHVQADDIPGDEWSWRKNYRVWEANRKVFLYPENYIEPELRDDKTPLFEELENELLQREINPDNVLEAYGKYMRGFDEVAHLKIAGSYHEKDDNSQTDVLHLFGVTADEPPMYYYRRVENIYYAEKRDDRGIVWDSWKKINVQIPVRKVAPIIYNGRLHVFWVRVTTLANTVFDSNRSVFTGYSHKVSIEFTTLKLDGTWTPPQKLNLKNCYPFTGNGVVQDPLVEAHEIGALMSQLLDILRSFPFFNLANLTDEINALKTPRYDVSVHNEAIDEYTLQGFMWDQVYPYVDSEGRLLLTGAGYQLRAAVDFYNLTIQDSAGRSSNVTGHQDPVMEALTFAKAKAGKIISRSGNTIYRTNSPSTQVFDSFAYGSLIVNTTKANPILRRHWNQSILNESFNSIYTEAIASLPSGSLVDIVNGAFGDAIIDVQGDLLLLQGTPIEGNGFVLKRIGTTLSETLTRTLFTSGVDKTLDISTQKALQEAIAPINITASRIQNEVVSGKLDFKGAYGNYVREIFFHIPFLIANHLNSQGKYADAQKWYHYIFNPTATEVINSPAGLTPAQKKKMEMDRNWQYLEFRGIDTQKLRDQLNDKQAIEVYKKDPFNPHAIARLRLSAYQKSIVMKYVDNLLDWGDQLFTQDTMESINEATLLYIVAKEILGQRPAQLGDCGEGKVSLKNYQNIQPLLSKGSEFLAELESYTIVRTPSKSIKRKAKLSYLETSTIKESAKFTTAKSKFAGNYAFKSFGLQNKEFIQVKDLKQKHMSEVTVKPVDDKITGAFSIGTVNGLKWRKDSIYVKDKYRIPSFGWSIMKHVSPVFCVPGNKDLLDYYNRVDDRLFKVRNCMNIQGQRRQLALFAPEIDPRLLVRARAAGLSLEDILNATNGNLPPYRFTYILEKAKAFTSVVQSFGASLLSAIEKRNAEELTLIRMTQQQNILEMSSKSRLLEIKSAEEGIKVLNDRIESLNYQIGYYDNLISGNRNAWEVAQSIGRHTSSVISGVALPLWSLTGVFGLIPQVGSPFAMKYGGVELKGGAEGFAKAVDTGAALSEAVAASSGLEAGFDRRSEGWKHQKKLLENELKQTNKNLVAAEIRRDILIESQKIHEKNVEHNKDVMDFYGEKFSNLGLYTWLSTTMQRMYKEAFSNAMAVARLAEQAYRYERDDNSIFVEGSYFESSRGGLLAGERLLMALQTMERRYLETNYRKNEIDQAFSLTQINPAALLVLKQTGECTFDIPEVYFDLFYPGQYRRKIQSVRLTIPSVTGPYTNVSATLSLMSSQIRMEAKLGTAELKPVPKSRTTTIATSTAQNDAGVFQLNFRDDRYMPFEGAGAISAWKLSLPKNFRQFDYSTINDVIIHVSYTAEYEELFRDNVEKVSGEIETLLKSNNAPMRRVISLRQEFSHDFHRLTGQPVNTPISLKIQNKHFPLFMNGKTLQLTKADLILITPKGQTVSGLSISINSDAQTGFTKNPAAVYGDLFSGNLALSTVFGPGGILRDHTIAIVAAGDVAPTAPSPGNVAAIDTDKLEDVILYLEYKIG